MKHDLSSITFVIPYYRDSEERKENRDYICNFLLGNFTTNILIIGDEVGLRKELSYEGIFYRTKAINDGIRKAITQYVAIYDTDVIFEVGNMIRAYELLKLGHTLTYPYSGKFVNIARSFLKNGIIKESESYSNGSYGGAVFVDKEKYRLCGWENENIIGWGFEDSERVDRIRTLGHSIARIEGTCWHIQHSVNKHSSTQNPFWKRNQEEFYRIKKMAELELRKEIKKWKWAE